jgi:nickel-dependent lactate racemase
MRVTMAYGKRGLPIDFPDDRELTVIRKPPMPVVGSPADAVRAALEAPHGSTRLEEAARGANSACILVCDVTRPVPNGLLLRPVIDRLAAAGVPSERVTVLVATGMHRPNEGAELAEVIGDPWVLAHCRVENHDATRAADHATLGTTTAGVPVRVDRRFVEAGVRIALGLVEPHFMAGWSGGRKLIAPGVSHADTVMALHAASMIGHPRADNGILDGNPVHGAQLEILAMVGPVLAVNVVIDERRRLSFVAFGDMAVSHAAAVAFAEPYFRLQVAEPFPVVVTSSAGWPLDATWYQAVKGVVAAAPIVEPGGELVVVSECSEGLGSAGFRRAQERLASLGARGFLAEARSRPRAEHDEWETVMLLKALQSGANVTLATAGLSEGEAGIAGVRVARDPAAAVGAALARGARRVAVVPEGPYVTPYVRGRS